MALTNPLQFQRLRSSACTGVGGHASSSRSQLSGSGGVGVVMAAVEGALIVVADITGSGTAAVPGPHWVESESLESRLACVVVGVQPRWAVGGQWRVCVLRRRFSSDCRKDRRALSSSSGEEPSSSTSAISAKVTGCVLKRASRGRRERLLPLAGPLGTGSCWGNSSMAEAMRLGLNRGSPKAGRKQPSKTSKCRNTEELQVQREARGCELLGSASALHSLDVPYHPDQNSGETQVSNQQLSSSLRCGHVTVHRRDTRLREVMSRVFGRRMCLQRYRGH
ncbi:hypothetical protein EYF80_009958 [Liparis tanakae]|uniref:Uncharacterized protein n=1 Tax=Liparis tanakae TaxID=230148 RepID=A0A4Z2IQ12_9TELE|nr:hypothetical protein EYF80_009958 [Liparis tanakae]